MPRRTDVAAPRKSHSILAVPLDAGCIRVGQLVTRHANGTLTIATGSGQFWRVDSRFAREATHSERLAFARQRRSL